jgi:DNA-binding response OmpR family regulator
MIATKETILVVEDEKDMSMMIRHALAQERFRVTCAGDGESGLRLARELKPDLIILDIMLPKLGGLDMLRVLRPETKSIIILVTAKHSEMDRILGLKLGADDYVVKPFSIGELLARIEGYLHRAAPPLPGAGDKTPLRVGEMEVDFERHEILVKGEQVHLAPKELAILNILIEAGEKGLPRGEFLKIIWGHEESATVDKRTVDQHVARLRRKLGPEGARIVTIANFGYQIDRH